MTDASTFESFGREFLRLVLHKQRVVESVERALGPGFELGPIPAGPGRRFAKATARGVYGGSYADELPGDMPSLRVFVPVDVAFEVEVAGQALKFHADVVAPLILTMALEPPITVIWQVTPPTEDDIELEVSTQQRASSFIKKISGFENDLRAFLVRFVHREMEKPHVQKAMRIPLVEVIDGAWPTIADQFLPPDHADLETSPLLEVQAQ